MLINLHLFDIRYSLFNDSVAPIIPCPQVRDYERAEAYLMSVKLLSFLQGFVELRKHGDPWSSIPPGLVTGVWPLVESALNFT
jgi:hypothetical protein